MTYFLSNTLMQKYSHLFAKQHSNEKNDFALSQTILTIKKLVRATRDQNSCRVTVTHKLQNDLIFASLNHNKKILMVFFLQILIFVLLVGFSFTYLFSLLL